MKNRKIHFVTQAALIAAIYVVMTYLFSPLSFSAVQVRLSEALMIMPLFTASAVPGLFIGCLIGNILGGALLPDIVFGSIATLIGAVLTYRLREKGPVISMIPPIVSNSIIIPFVLKYAYGINMPVLLMVITVGIGEIISCGLLGNLLYRALTRCRFIFSQN